jgi:hypothetical protein
VPSLCLVAAEADRKGDGEPVASLPRLVVEPPDLTAGLDAGAPVGGGADWRIAHAVHAARPSAEWPGGRTVLSVRPEFYDGAGIDPLDPDAI